MHNQKATEDLRAVKIKISDISEEGLTVSEEVDPAGMDLDTQVLKFLPPLRLTAGFQRERETVLVEVSVKGQTEQTCGRCLEPYARSYDNEFNLDYEIREDPFLDITDDVRQEILLSYPVRFLCKEDCRGLCPRCGANLNESKGHAENCPLYRAP